jgi:5'-methylthioadenosine phosphorylase
MIKAAIIGGTGHEKPDYLEKVKEVSIDTPYGKPNSAIYSGIYNNMEVFHIARHGMSNSIPSYGINYKANFYILKELQCNYILATTTCGSLQEEVCPGEFMILDQFIDMTHNRLGSLFKKPDEGAMNHLPLINPFSEELRDHLIEAAIVNGITVHTKGTVICIDGPRYSSRAESNLYRSWGADIINMTTVPEVLLANELGIPFAELALCIEYDSWRLPDEDTLSVPITEIITSSRDKIITLLTYALQKIEE